MAFTQTSIERVRKYWNDRPCNIRHSSAPIGTKEYSDEVEKRKYFVEPHIPQFADFKAWAGKKVLEVGCGIGTDTINFARAGAIVTAVDVSDKSLYIAQQRLAENKLRVTFKRADAEQLDEHVPAEDYDLIYAFGSIHHSPDPEKIINRLYWYSKRGTTVKIMVYNRRSWKVLWVLLKYGKGRFWKLPELVAKYSEAETGCPVTHTFTRRSLKRLLEKYGFRVQQICVDHIFPYDVEEYKQYRYKKVWYFRWIPAPVFRVFEKMFGWHLMVTATCP